jgi:hypothetical protein
MQRASNAWTQQRKSVSKRPPAPGPIALDSGREPRAERRRRRFEAVAITYHFEGDFLFTAIEGPTSYWDVRAYLDKLMADPGFRPGMPGLIDCRRAKSLFSIADLRRTAQDSRQRPQLQVPGRAAVLASSNLIYGLLRMYEVFNEGSPSQIRVFRKPEEAMAWLKGGGDG